MRPTDHPSVRAIAERQAGIIATSQFPTDVTQSAINAAVARGVWARPTPRVIATSNGRLDHEQTIWVTLLASPAGSAVSGPTAAMIDGMRSPFTRADTNVYLTLPRGRHRGPMPAIYHWSDHLAEADIAPNRTPRRTRLPRSVVDWASWQPHERERAARLIILSAVQQGVVSPDQLREHLARRGHCRHHAMIAESITDAEGGVQSLPELDFTRLVRRSGLPGPSRQVVRVRPDGRAYLDVAWEEFGLSGEIEGARHFWVENREADLDRHNDLVIAHENVLYFSSFAVRRRGCLVIDVLSRALRSYGWTGEHCAVLPPGHADAGSPSTIVCTCGRLEHHTPVLRAS